MKRAYWIFGWMITLGACVQQYNPFPDPPDFAAVEFSSSDRPAFDGPNIDARSTDGGAQDAGLDSANDGGGQDGSSDAALSSDFAHDGGLAGDGGATILFFSTAKQFAAGNNFTLRALRLTHLNNDGALDAVAVSNGFYELFLGNGQGNLPFYSEFTSASGSLDVAVNDLNGDGVQDLIVPAYFAEAVNVRLGALNPGYTAQNSTAYPVGGGSSAVLSVDLNDDKKLDLVVANATDNTISTLLGKGDGTFQPENRFTSTTTPGALVSGDFNGDKKIDIVSANSSTDNIAMLLGDNAGGLLAPVYTGTGVQPISLVVADFDKDKNLDIATANANSVTVLFGKGDGSFTVPGLQIPLNVSPRFIATGDLDRDGLPDLVLPVSGSNFALALLGLGSRQFSPVQSLLTDVGTNAVAIGDLNGDSKPDLVFTADVASPTLGALVVLLNQTP